MSWVDNSLVYFRNGGDFNNGLAIASMASTSCLLLHSMYMHRLKFKNVRVLVDICSFSGLVTGATIYWSNQYPTAWNVAIGADLLAFGICSTAMALVDSLITYTRYNLIAQKTKWRYLDYFVGVYLFLFIVCTTLPFYTIVPCFVYLSSGDGLVALNSCLSYIYAPAFTIFNLAFSWVFVRKILGFKSTRLEGHPKLLELAYKSAAHTTVSIFMNSLLAALSNFNPVRAQLLYAIVVPVQLHFLFNWHGEWSHYASVPENMSEKIIEINKRLKANRVSPYSADFSNKSIKDVPKPTPSGPISTKPKYGPEFLKPINLVEEVCKAIDDMEAQARTNALNVKVPPPRRNSQSISSHLFSGHLGSYQPQRRNISVKDNSLFVDHTSRSGDTADSVLMFAAEEGFI